MNSGFEGSRKEFWTLDFCGEEIKKKETKYGIFEKEAGVSVKRIGWKHYKRLGKVSVNTDFEEDWKEVVEGKVSMYGSLSEVREDQVLDKEDRNREVHL